MHRLTIICLSFLFMFLSEIPVRAEQATPFLHQIGRGDIQSVV